MEEIKEDWEGMEERRRKRRIETCARWSGGEILASPCLARPPAMAAAVLPDFKGDQSQLRFVLFTFYRVVKRAYVANYNMI